MPQLSPIDARPRVSFSLDASLGDDDDEAAEVEPTPESPTFRTRVSGVVRAARIASHLISKTRYTMPFGDLAMTQLMHACATANFDKVKLLIDAFEPEALALELAAVDDWAGSTPLHWAACTRARAGCTSLHSHASLTREAHCARQSGHECCTIHRNAHRLPCVHARTHTRAHMPDGFMTRGGRLWERVHRAGAAHRRSQGRPAQCSRRFDGRAPGRPVRTFFLSLGADARPYASLSHTLTHPSHTSC